MCQGQTQCDYTRTYQDIIDLGVARTVGLCLVFCYCVSQISLAFLGSRHWTSFRTSFNCHNRIQNTWIMNIIGAKTNSLPQIIQRYVMYLPVTMSWIICQSASHGVSWGSLWGGVHRSDPEVCEGKGQGQGSKYAQNLRKNSRCS